VTDEADALERGRQTLSEMAELAGDSGHPSNRRRWDRLVTQWLADRKVLAGSEAGRAAVAAMMDDPRPTVRLWTAAATLFWDPEAARPVLVEIREFPLSYDLHAITAKHTLLEFEAGRLDDDAPLPGSPGSTTA
jgi:hypothetical protein